MGNEVVTPIKISVIVPVYKVERYLEKCLDSIVRQTLKDIQIICVNDGSPDNSLSILNRYHENDARVIIITQENQGLSAARNSGLKKAVGEYVYFIDSDDYLGIDDALERMYEASISDDIDILSFNHRTIGIEEKECIRDIENNTIVSGKMYMQGFRMGGVMVWLRLYRREYMESLRFTFTPEILAEDDEAYPRLYCDAKKVKHIEDVLLVYRRREGSNSTSEATMQLIDGLIAVVKTYFSLCECEGDTEFNKYLYNKALEYIFILYEKTFFVDDGVTAIAKYDKLIRAVKFTRFEERLIQNEEKFIAYAKIEKKRKKYKLSVYYTRRLRIYYFKHVRKYGCEKLVFFESPVAER